MIHDLTYRKMVHEALNDGERHADRTGVGTRSVFGACYKFDLQAGFPLVSAKKTPFMKAAHELLWILSGSTYVRDLQKRGVHIWDPWVTPEKLAMHDRDPDALDLGPSYGHQWRDFGGEQSRHGCGTDQLAELLKNLVCNPGSRRHLVTLWHPEDVVVLDPPPCLATYQFKVRADGMLDMCLYQRSLDLFLGAPFDLAEAGILLTLLAHYTGLKPGTFTWMIGDMHVYENHVALAQTMLSRSAAIFNPCLRFVNGGNIGDLKALLATVPETDLLLSSYNPHPHMPAPVAV